MNRAVNQEPDGLNAPVLLAVDFGGTTAGVGIAASDGQFLAKDSVSVADAGEAHRVVESVLSLARALLGDREPLAIGVSSMGITDETGVRLAPNVPGWVHLALPGELRNAFPGVPHRIANDVKAALTAEMRWGALQGEDPVAYVNWGTGIGMAFGQRGLVWPGVHGAAGEIAYLSPLGSPRVREGGSPLEERVGGAALDRTARDRFGLAGGFPEACRLADERPEVARWVREVVRETGWMLAQALLVLDVAQVALGGGVGSQWRRFAPAIRATWRDAMPYPPRLVKARFGQDAALVGALALALDLL